MQPETSQGLYKIKTISERTGFSPTLLRAWERRYRLLEPQRANSSHRLYTEDDLQVLLRVRALLAQGRSIGEVVALGRGALLARPGLSAGPASPGEQGAPELHQLAQSMVEAALEVDEEAVSHLLDRGFAVVSVNQAIEHIIIPAARKIGELWSEHNASVAAEHLLTAVIGRRLQRLIDVEAQHLTGARTALCACLPDEQHELGCLVVAHQLLKMGFCLTYLGASLPLEDLERAIVKRRPDYVFLSVSRAPVLELHRPRLLEILSRHSQKVGFVLGGGGIRAADQADLVAAGAHLWPAERPLSEFDLSFLAPSKQKTRT